MSRFTIQMSLLAFALVLTVGVAVAQMMPKGEMPKDMPKDKMPMGEMKEGMLPSGEMQMAPSGAQIELQLAMRKLWEDHIGYTRNYIISALAGLPDADAVAARLLKNQDEIGDAIKPYYGEAAGAKLSELLRAHIMIASEVVSAAKSGKATAVDAAEKKWHANADEIATFLSGANPNWTKQDLTDMLYKHLELTTGEAVARLKMDWAGDIQNCDMNHMHMLMFADMLTAGIVKQFPEKFE
jgi:hypothetical protein